MADCHGNITCSTKVDDAMREFIEAEAERLGVPRAELHRRLLDFYKRSREDETPCPHCADDITINLRE